MKDGAFAVEFPAQCVFRSGIERKTTMGDGSGKTISIEASRIHPVISIRVGTLEVRPSARVLFIGGVEAEIGGRAFDLLLALLAAQGAIIPKEELLRRVWPSLTVVDHNLQVQLSLLRRALGTEAWRLKTINGKGYCLVCAPSQAASPAGVDELARSAQDGSLVIVVEAEPDACDLLMRAVSDMAKGMAGVTRLELLFGEVAKRERLSNLDRRC